MDKKNILNKLILFALLLLLPTTCYGQTPDDPPGEYWDFLYTGECFSFERNLLLPSGGYDEVQINFLIKGGGNSSSGLLINFNEEVLEFYNLFLFPSPPFTSPDSPYPLTAFIDFHMEDNGHFGITIINGLLNEDWIILFINSASFNLFYRGLEICWGSR